MAENKQIGVPHNTSLCAEDYIILTVIVICLLGPIIMFGAWQVYNIYFPPALSAVFLGIAVAALLYRFLGGIHEATFAVGALKITGSAAVLAGIAWWSNGELQKQMEVYNSHKNNVGKFETELEKNTQLRSRIIKLQSEHKSLELERDTLSKEVNKLKQGIDLIKVISELEPDQEVSGRIRDIALSRKGPWCPVSSTKTLRVSVAGYLKSGEVASCPEYYGKELEITSEYQYAGEYIRASSTVTIIANKYISRALDCSDKRDFQLQLNCTDAERIFTNKILGCSYDGAPKWKVEDRKLPISAVLVVNGET